MDMDHYYSILQDISLAGFRRFNQSNQVETQQVEFSAGTVDTSVIRGNLLEKAATVRIRLTTKNPETGEDTRFDVFQIKVYPSNPTIPILLFNLENRVTREDRFGGFLDVAPVAANPADLKCMADGIRLLTDEYGIDYEPLRKRVVNMYKRDQWNTALNAAVGIRLELPAKQFDFVSKAALKWIEWYFTIVDTKRDAPYTIEDTTVMNQVRGRILEFYMLKDMSFQIIQKLGVPLEIMAGCSFPPYPALLISFCVK